MYAYGVNVVPMDIPWGTAPSPDELKGLLEKNQMLKRFYEPVRDINGYCI
jgi:aspartate aminotransferase-like enzyme